MSRPLVSVVVPTRDRPDALERCLAALGRQTGVEIEAIVVDDGSADAGAVARVAAAAGATLVRLDGRGPAAARNAGASRARGAVVCLTDDDCEPGERWVRVLADEVVASGAVIGGRSTPGDPTNPFDVAAERITSHLRSYSAMTSPDRCFLPSNNVACLRSLLQEIPFDESYGVGGEDRDWCARVAEAGVQVRLVPDAVIAHRPGLDLRRFWRQQVRYGIGAGRFTAERGPLLQGAGFYFELLRGAARGGAASFLLVLLAQAATLVGVVKAHRTRQDASGDG